MRRALKLLSESEYLRTHSLTEKNPTCIEFLKNAKVYQDQLLNHWKLFGSDSISHYNEITSNVEVNNDRLSFLKDEHFTKRLEKYSKQSICLPDMAKTVCYGTESVQNSCFFIKSSKDIKLVTDYFTHASRGRDMFYNIQRERKIWWMRYSADPSRYVVESFDVSEESRDEFTKKCQSITIKSKTFGNTIEMETIVLAHLNEFGQLNTILNNDVSVVRSVVDLNLATAGLLLDGVTDEHGRDVLKLNRKLAPYQCLLVSGEISNEILNELCVHLKYVLNRAGLRLYDNHISDAEDVGSIWSKADVLGIPYAVIVEKNALKTGLLRLRNRDTTLSETIHISDLKPYLLKLFKE
ncbi:DNA polymerase subunit gamma-2, mitochondrial [Musca vetustissima]|uniref:DNA polymerase subunit gamma-2, mitochondrial n=1 Tax=Musca vetustissima TaxID=27455 RepID=UPI002AB5E996|nr:DNA polymerase subunit gamma-2, mitochondrial [Musca vetustissima]